MYRESSVQIVGSWHLVPYRESGVEVSETIDVQVRA